MKQSHPVYGYSKMSNLQYWGIGILQGIDEVKSNVMNWFDLMTDNYEEYFSFDSETKAESCRLNFWDGLNEQVYEKEFIEEIYEIMEDIESGKVKLIPFTKEMWDEIDALTEGVGARRRMGSINRSSKAIISYARSVLYSSQIN